MHTTSIAAIAIVLCLLQAGCSPFTQRSTKSYTTVVTDSNHNSDKARSDCQRAARLFEKGDLEKAEMALQDALIADVSYAPAHNNLGRIYFDQGKLYLAAWEFECARRLLPDSAQVVNNLAMVYEAAGQTERAIEHYSMALGMDPGNPEYTGNLARLLAREQRDPMQLAALLQDLLLYDSRPEWVGWAREQLSLRADVRAASHAQSTFAELVDPGAQIVEPTQETTLPATEALETLPAPINISDIPPQSDRNSIGGNQ